MKRTKLLITAATTGLVLAGIGIPTAVNALSTSGTTATTAAAPTADKTADKCKYPANKTPTLTLGPSAVTISKGSSTTLSGTLKGNDCPIPKATVGLFSRASEKDDWAIAGSTTTSDAGAYTFTVKPTTTTSYRTGYAGQSGTWDPAISTTSSTVTVKK